jgi:hypothetical protein
MSSHPPFDAHVAIADYLTKVAMATDGQEPDLEEWLTSYRHDGRQLDDDEKHALRFGFMNQAKRF